MFSLKRPIAPNITADGDDVFNMKAALRKIGFYRGPADPIADHEMIRGIKNLQAATGLAVNVGVEVAVAGYGRHRKR